MGAVDAAVWADTASGMVRRSAASRDLNMGIVSFEYPGMMRDRTMA